MTRAILLVACLTLVSTVSAQNKRIIERSQLRYMNSKPEKETPKLRHLTLELLTSEEGRKALDEFSRLKSSGQIPYARKGGSVDIGEKKIFTVRVLDSQAGAWESVEFTKKAEEPLFDLWVETAEFANGNVTDQDIEEMRLAFN